MNRKNITRLETAFVVSDATMSYYSFGGINKQIDLERNNRDQWYARYVATEKEYDLDMDRDEFSEDQWTAFVDTRIVILKKVLAVRCSVC